MAFWDFLNPTPASATQVEKLTPGQVDMRNWMLGQAQQGLTQSMDFNPIAMAAQNRFAQQTTPQIGAQFGGYDAQRSSNYNQAMANAQRDLQLNLAGQQQQFQQQNQKTWTDMLSEGLTPTNEIMVEEGRESPWANVLSQAAQLGLHGAAAFATGGGSVPFSAQMMMGGNAGQGDYSKLEGMFGRARDYVFGGNAPAAQNVQSAQPVQQAAQMQQAEIPATQQLVSGARPRGGYANKRWRR